MHQPDREALIARLKLADPRDGNGLFDLGVEIRTSLGLPPSVTTGDENPAQSLDAAMAMIQPVLAQPHLSVSVAGMLNGGVQMWRAELEWPSNIFVGKAQSPAIALSIAILRAADVYDIASGLRPRPRLRVS